MAKKKPVIMLDLNHSSSFGGPFIVAKRIANSSLKREFKFIFLEYGNASEKTLSVKRLGMLIQQLRQHSPDIVHFSGLQLSGFMIAIACLFSGNRRTLMTIRGTSADALDLPIHKKVLVSWVMEPFTCLLVRYFYCNSRYTETRLISRIFSYKRLPYIYNYHALSDEKALPGTMREEIGFAVEDVIIISTGRITADKGYDLYCEIVEEVLEKEQSAKFLLVGDGNYLSTLKQRLNRYLSDGSLVCLGYREDVSNLNKISDIYLNPSLHETLSMSTIEAMSCSLASVVSDEGGLKELITEGIDGFRCCTTEPSQYAERLLTLTRNARLREKMGSSAQKRIKGDLSEEHISSKLSETYWNVIRA